jgi:glutathione S-transferase
VLLTLEEKKVPYEMKLIDVQNKPDWSVPSPSPHTLN